MSIIKVWNNSSWVSPFFAYPKIWDGTEWVYGKTSVWLGSTWDANTAGSGPGPDPGPSGTYTPAGSSSSGSPVILYNYQLDGIVSITISSTTPAVWNYTRASGSFGNANVPTGASTNSIIFSMPAGSSGTNRFSSWNLSGTISGVSTYWLIQLETDSSGSGGSA